MKHELWAEVVAEFQQKKQVPFTIDSINYANDETRGGTDKNRRVFKCESMIDIIHYT